MGDGVVAQPNVATCRRTARQEIARIVRAMPSPQGISRSATAVEFASAVELRNRAAGAGSGTRAPATRQSGARMRAGSFSTMKPNSNTFLAAAALCRATCPAEVPAPLALINRIATMRDVRCKIRQTECTRSVFMATCGWKEHPDETARSPRNRTNSPSANATIVPSVTNRHVWSRHFD